jgi:aminopeptidase N
MLKKSGISFLSALLIAAPGSDLCAQAVSGQVPGVKLAPALSLTGPATPLAAAPALTTPASLVGSVIVAPTLIPTAQAPAQSPQAAAPMAKTAPLAAIQSDGDAEKKAAALNETFDNQAPVEAETDVDAGPLPRVAEPSLYKISAKIFPDEGRFTSAGHIRLAMKQRRDSITLHAADMEITKVIFRRAGEKTGTVIDPKTLVWDKEKGRVTIPIGAAHEGRADLYLEIAAKLKTQGAGPYITRDSYKGKMENYVVTQFEATDARQFFPMFDEPGYKAKFDLTLDAPAWHTVRSNMPAKRETVVGDRKIVKFQRTPKMSSYLLSFVSGRFDYIAGKVGGIKIRVYGHPDRIRRQGRLAMQGLKKFIRWGGEYFGKKFPLPKHDVIAVADFTAGAMENWGMNTFREESLMYDPKRSGAESKEVVLQVISHENAHSWFGDLVTMSWWNGLWLNEAFANLMESKAVDRFYPTVGIWKSVEASKQKAMEVDAQLETRGVQTLVKTEAEIDAIFDAITYEKGGSVLQMLDHYLTEPVFQKGVQLYIKRHAHKNASPEDLWKALADASQDPRIVEIGTKWVTQSGFPIVSVESAVGTALRLAQRRFMANGTKNDHQLWPIPMVVSYQLKGESQVRTHRFVFDRKQAEVTLPGRGELLWVNTNEGQAGFYRSALSDGLHKKLLDNGFVSLSAVERVGLLNDLWARAQAGDLPIDAYLDSLAMFQGEEDRIVLDAMHQGLAGISDKLLTTDAQRQALGKFARALVGKQWTSWGWGKPGDGNDRKRSRAMVLGILGRFDPDAALVRDARKKLDRYLSDPASVDPNLTMELLEIGARNGDRKLFDRILAAYKKSDVADQKEQLMLGLGMFRDPALIQAALDLTFAKTKDSHGEEFDVIRGQDITTLLSFMLRDCDTQAAAYKFVVSRWKDIREKAGSFGAERVVRALADVHDAPVLKHMRGFFAAAANREPQADRALKQSVQFAENSIAFQHEAGAAAGEWLAHSTMMARDSRHPQD